jgi:uncharacterized protein YceH (UPF0502 family)
MILDPAECRVLGVLVEKAQTVPGQYPMTLNAMVSGCNQRNNREPVTHLEEDDVLAALDTLRGKGLVREVMLSGSRVAKFKHDARAALEVETPALVVLAELLLRGPQTVGELRTRASRMHPLESTEVVHAVLESMADREAPLVRRIGPAAGGRADRWVQLLCPDLHPLDAPAASGGSGASGAAFGGGAAGVERLESRIAALEMVVRRLAAALGEPTPELDAGDGDEPSATDSGVFPEAGRE